MFSDISDTSKIPKEIQNMFSDWYAMALLISKHKVASNM